MVVTKICIPCDQAERTSIASQLLSNHNTMAITVNSTNVNDLSILELPLHSQATQEAFFVNTSSLNKAEETAAAAAMLCILQYA